jgi:enamine deaminase RidA (YjgF/YER057c/UK114 family)
MPPEPHLTHLPAPAGVAPPTGYSHAVWGTGTFVAISGQVALDEHGQVVGGDDPEAQARQVFGNLGRSLAAAGAGWGDVVKLGFFVTDVAFLPAVRAVRDAHIDPARPPASTAVQVAALIRSELLVEVDAFALVPAANRNG